MNRILTADVILTLTAEQMSRLLACTHYAARTNPEPQYRELDVLLCEQASKQGVLA